MSARQTEEGTIALHSCAQPPQRCMWAESSAQSMQQLTGSTINISRVLPPITMSTCLQKWQRKQGPFGFIIVKKYFSLSFGLHWLETMLDFSYRKTTCYTFFSRVWPVLVLWMPKTSAVGASHSSLHIWSRAEHRSGRTAHRGGKGRGLRRCWISRRQSVTAMVARATAVPNLPAQWGAARRRSPHRLHRG